MQNKKPSIIISGSVASDMKDLETRMFDKREHCLLPATMMVVGSYYPYVENINDAASIYFSEMDLKDSLDSWSGRPVSINHPEDQGTCNCPEVIEKQVIGQLFYPRYDPDSKSLKAELWIDSTKGEAIVERVKKGSHIDVSIGAFGDLIPRNKNISSEANYDYKMTNIRGDHLAVLPDGMGACCWEDGCGIRASVFAHYVASIKDKARTPAYDGVESASWSSISKSLKAYLKGYSKHTGKSGEVDSSLSINDIPLAAKKWIASKSLLGDSVGKNSRDLIFFPVVNPMTNKLNEGALRAVLSGRGSQAKIPDAARVSAQKKAELLLNSNFKKKLMEGKSMVESSEEKRTQCCEAEAVKMSSQEEVKKDRKFDASEWLQQAPEDYRNFVVNSMSAYNANRDKHIKNIVSCKSVEFCEDRLSNISDMKTLEGVSTLVDQLRVKEEGKVDFAAEQKIHDYQLRAHSRNPVEAHDLLEFSVPKTIPKCSIDQKGNIIYEEGK